MSKCTGRLGKCVLLAALLIGLRNVSVAAPAPMGKTGRAKPTLLYHPTEVGAKWVFDTGGHIDEEFVIAAEDKDGATIVSVGRTSPFLGKKVWPSRVVSVSEGGVCILAVDLGGLTEPLWLLKLPHAPGNQWEAVLAGEPWGRAEGAAVADGPERVEVPAGIFRAIRVRLELPYIDGREGMARKTIWFAPGIGMVKEVYGDRITVLVAFTPGKAQGQVTPATRPR